MRLKAGTSLILRWKLMRSWGILCRHRRPSRCTKTRWGCLNSSSSTRVCRSSSNHSFKDNLRWCSPRTTSMCWYKLPRDWYQCPSSPSNNYLNSSSRWVRLDICNPSSSIPCINLNSSSYRIKWVFLHRYSHHEESRQRYPKRCLTWALQLVKRPKMSRGTDRWGPRKSRIILSVLLISSHHLFPYPR